MSGRGTAAAVAVAPDGGLTVAGTGKTAAGEQAAALVRYRPDGELDPSFGSGGVALSLLEGDPAGLRDLALRPDGSIIASGGALGSTFFSHPSLAAFTAAGALDLSFAGDGVVRMPGPATSSALESVAIAPDGRILTTGQFVDGNFVVARLLADGTFDSSFSGDGQGDHRVRQQLSTAVSVALDPEGRIVVAGERVVSGFRDDEYRSPLPASWSPTARTTPTPTAISTAATAARACPPPATAAAPSSSARSPCG